MIKKDQVRFLHFIAHEIASLVVAYTVPIRHLFACQIINEKKWFAPLYWEKKDGEWFVKTLSGLRKLNEHEPVSHVSYYEAEAYALGVGSGCQ